MRRAAAALLLAALATSGCGAQAPDLFAVQRSGQGPQARLRLVVSDSGEVTCNGSAHRLGADLLLRAREVARQLGDLAQLHLELPPGPGASVLSYRVRLESGTVAFSDTSEHLPPSFTAVEALTKDVAEDVCGIER